MVPLAAGLNIGSSDPERLTVATRHSTDCYPLPEWVGSIVKVQLATGAPKAFLFLEAPCSQSYVHLYTNGNPPQTPFEARSFLRTIHERLRVNLWFRLGDDLYLYPAPVNSGETLIVDFLP